MDHRRRLNRISPGAGQPASQVTLEAYPRPQLRRGAGRLSVSDPRRRHLQYPGTLELDNPEACCADGMFAQVAPSAGDPAPKAVVPSSAIIDDAERRVVLIALGEGRFKPAAGEAGARAGDVVGCSKASRRGSRGGLGQLPDRLGEPAQAALSNLVEPDRRSARGAPTVTKPKGRSMPPMPKRQRDDDAWRDPCLR